MTTDWEGGEGEGGATVCLSVIPPPPRPFSQFTLMITETGGGREGGGNYAVPVSVQLILSLLTGAAGSFSARVLSGSAQSVFVGFCQFSGLMNQAVIDMKVVIFHCLIFSSELGSISTTI